VNEDRRPLASRDTGWARALAHRAAAAGVTPNAISIASVGCAAAGAAGLCLAAGSPGLAGMLWLLLAVFGCQLRLLCNLIDGMVAIEGGRASATGVLWNEFPDRLSDLLLLAAAGYLAGRPELGWAAATVAVLTAYVRELGHRLTGVADFGGWMAKPQRMAVLTLACLGAIGARLFGHPVDASTFQAALYIVLAGACWTVLARVGRLLQRLRTGSPR